MDYLRDLLAFTLTGVALGCGGVFGVALGAYLIERFT